MKTVLSHEIMNSDLPGLLNSLLLQPNECAGKVIVVTGAGRGIGKEIARAFAHLKGKVILAELSEEGRQVETDICQTGGEGFHGSKGDSLRRRAFARSFRFRRIRPL